jgi:hypothetical protein
MSSTQEYIGTLVIEACCNCGVAFGMTREFSDRRKRDHRDFYCPSGHGQHYTAESDAEREKRLRIAAQARAAILEDAYEMERRSKAALKGHLTRARNKIAAGNCPVPDCGQHFANVREHMKHKHPDWHLTDPETGKAAEL